MQRAVAAEARRDRVARAPRAAIGVIDIGSNTARFVAFEASTSRTVRAVYEAKDSPRLGLGTAHDASLSEAAFARGIATVRRFARLAARLELPRPLAVATSAVRDAPNSAEFLKDVERATDVRLRVLSGSEEARYGYLGAASAWQLDNDIVLDLGGGSLQLAEVHDGTLRNSVSLPLGALRTTQRFLEHDPPKRREVDALREHVRGVLDSAVAAFGGGSYRLIGLGGTVRSLARAAIELREYPVRRVHGYPLYDHDVESLHELLGEMSASKRRSVRGIGGDRADVVIAGLVVLEELLRAVRVDRIVVSSTGIREGLALEAIDAELPATAAELADRSVAAAREALALRADETRPALATTALALFDLLAERVEGGPSERLALAVAAGMHDAGIAIDLWNHARHAAYLVQNYPIWGLDQRQTLLASMAAYLHEGDPPPSEWKREFLPIAGVPEVGLAVRLGALLEAAELLAPARPRFVLGGRTLTVSFSAADDASLPPRWLEKLRRPMERAFGLEVRGRDAG